MEWNIALLIYAVLQFIAFLFVLVATPIVIFRFNDDGSNVTGFISLWGATFTVGNLSLFRSSSDMWDLCPARLMRFRVAQALAIISIFVYGTAFVLGVIMLFCCALLRWICLTLNIVGAVTVCFVWAAMVLTYFTDEGRTCRALMTRTKFGVGFVLFVIAWVLDVLNIVFLALPFHIAVLRKLVGANENSEENRESEVRSSQKEEE